MDGRVFPAHQDVSNVLPPGEILVIEWVIIPGDTGTQEFPSAGRNPFIGLLLIGGFQLL